MSVIALSAGSGAAVGILVANSVGGPATPVWVRLAAGGVAAVLTAAAVTRLTRVLVPLGLLLRLALVFPDRAPSRFRIALRTGNLRRLRVWVEEQLASPAPTTAAAQLETALTLAAALNAHDRRTRGHSDRVRALTDLVAEQLGLPEEDRFRLRWAALLHDIGKLSVPAPILNKRDRLEPAEWEVLRGHPAAGWRLAEPLSSWLGEWARAIDQHHERFDGTGYPRGLRGDEISLAGRIVSATDAFETMTAVRAYKRAMSVPAARRELVVCADTHFDPRVVRAFLNVSLGRLRWTLGLGALVAPLPLIGTILQTGARASLVGAAASSSTANVFTALSVTTGLILVPAAADLPAARPAATVRELPATLEVQPAEALPSRPPRLPPGPPGPSMPPPPGVPLVPPTQPTLPPPLPAIPKLQQSPANVVEPDPLNHLLHDLLG